MKQRAEVEAAPRPVGPLEDYQGRRASATSGPARPIETVSPPGRDRPIRGRRRRLYDKIGLVPGREAELAGLP